MESACDEILLIRIGIIMKTKKVTGTSQQHVSHVPSRLRARIRFGKNSAADGRILAGSTPPPGPRVICNFQENVHSRKHCDFSTHAP